jgi:hypothetical protein
MGFVSNGKPQHSAGGKVSLPLLAGCVGDAFFSEDGKHRHWLSRVWGHAPAMPYPLWIGMNPSTAAKDVDDSTIRREIEFTQYFGYTALFKCNVMDYCATKPKELIKKGVHPCSEENLATIERLAGGADKIILCYGNLPDPLRMYADAVLDRLKGKYQLWCLGTTQSGSPRHPLYVTSKTPLQRFKVP